MPNICQFILQFFTPRDWAAFTLIGLLIVFSARSKEVRVCISRVIKAFFRWKVLIVIISAQLYLSLFLGILNKYCNWNTTLLRETIFFLLFTSISLIFKYITNNECIASFKGIIADTIKATLIIEFYLNIYTFSYWAELAFQFFLSFFYIMGAYNKQETKELKTVFICTQTLFYGLSLFLVTYSVYMMFRQWQDVFSTESVISLLFPIMATIAYWPFLYLLAVYSAYENWFVRVFFASFKNKEVYKFRRNKIMYACKLNLNKINFVSKNFHIFVPQSQEQFVEDLKNSIKKYEKSKL